MKASHYIGIDLGATMVKLGIVTRNGKLCAKQQIPTDGVADPSVFIQAMGALIDDLLGRTAIETGAVGAIGVGAPGWVDHRRGVVRELTNLSGWEEFPLADELEKALGWKSFVDNDANVMGLAELVHGAGRGHRNLICLTLGTGVGGAIIIDGSIYRGNAGLAGEIGHIPVDPRGPQCACGGTGCLENYVGNRPIVADALSRLNALPDKGRDGIMLGMVQNHPERMTAGIVAAAAEQGDEIALETWREAGRRLGAALGGLVNLLNPECFIIGGGLAKAGDILFDPARQALESQAMNELGRSTPIIRAGLGEHAGIVGAATFAMTCSEGLSYSPTE